MMKALPDEASIAFMKQIQVRYVLIHVYFLGPEAVARLANAFVRDSSFRALGKYRDWAGDVLMFELVAGAP